MRPAVTPGNARQRPVTRARSTLSVSAGAAFAGEVKGPPGTPGVIGSGSKQDTAATDQRGSSREHHRGQPRVLRRDATLAVVAPGGRTLSSFARRASETFVHFGARRPRLRAPRRQAVDCGRVWPDR